MNRKSILSLVLGAVLFCLPLASCGGKTPTVKHTHAYTQWRHDEEQHWKVCPDDGAVDPAGKSAHDFTHGDCVCGAEKPEEVHTHTYTKWQFDDAWHWKVCPDDDAPDPAGKSGHTFVDGVCECGAREPDSKLAFALDETTGTYTVVGRGEETADEIVIPASYQGKRVTKIGAKAFYENNQPDPTLTSVTLPETLTEIEYNAFTHCTALKEINLEHVETIGQSAFWDVGLTDADLSSAASIESYAFYACLSLERVTLGEDVMVGNAAFSGCTLLSDITFGPLMRVEAKDASETYSNFYNIAKDVEIHFNGSIEEWCALDGGVFRGGLMCNDKYYNRGAGRLYTDISRTLYFNGTKFEGALSIPATVDMVPAFAFLNTRSITSLTIPKSVKSIGEGAFEQVAAVDTLPVTYEGTLAEFCGMEEAWLVRCANYTEYTVNGQKLAGELAIPTGVESIPAGAFFAVKGVTSVSLPTSVQQMGIYALCALEISEITYAGTETEWYAVFRKQAQSISYCGIPGEMNMGRPSSMFVVKTAADEKQTTWYQYTFQR